MRNTRSLLACLGLTQIDRNYYVATFAWNRDHGVASGSPAKGATRSLSVADVNWKNSDVEATAYTDAPIIDGSNSFDNWLFGSFSGTFNQILAGKFAHTAGAFGVGLTLKGPASCSGDGNRPLYTTPATTTNATLTTDMTTAISIASGVDVCFGPTGPEATGKATTMTTNPCYTNYLPTQLQTNGAVAGDTATVTLTLQYQEN